MCQTPSRVERDREECGKRKVKKEKFGKARRRRYDLLPKWEGIESENLETSGEIPLHHPPSKSRFPLFPEVSSLRFPIKKRIELWEFKMAGPRRGGGGDSTRTINKWTQRKQFNSLGWHPSFERRGPRHFSPGAEAESEREGREIDDPLQKKLIL